VRDGTVVGVLAPRIGACTQRKQMQPQAPSDLRRALCHESGRRRARID